MRIRVCSGFSPTGRVQYGERFLRSFDRHWPKSVELLVYVERPMDMPRDAFRLLWDIEGAVEFNTRYAEDARAQGRVAMPCWKSTEVAKGYSFRTDAYKFWKQIVIPQAAADDHVLGPLEDGDVLVWLDADVETIRPMPDNFVEHIMQNRDLCFIGREPRHSEIGFWSIRMNGRSRRFLREIAAMYLADQVFGLSQWHSAFVWDHVRHAQADPLSEQNLNPRNRQGHVWPLTALGAYTRHDKGGRKPR